MDANHNPGQLAGLLAEAYHDIDRLKEELVAANRRAENHESLVRQLASQNGMSSETTHIIANLQSNLALAERARVDSDARVTALLRTWEQTDRYLANLELRAAQARSNISAAFTDPNNLAVHGPSPSDPRHPNTPPNMQARYPDAISTSQHPYMKERSPRGRPESRDPSSRPVKRPRSDMVPDDSPPKPWGDVGRLRTVPDWDNSNGYARHLDEAAYQNPEYRGMHPHYQHRRRRSGSQSSQSGDEHSLSGPARPHSPDYYGHLARQQPHQMPRIHPSQPIMQHPSQRLPPSPNSLAHPTTHVMQTHTFAPPVTGAPQKKASFVPPPNAPGAKRTCRQCGAAGRYKEGRCVEKWGPGPEGPGTVCDRCRKKLKRGERKTQEANEAQARAAQAAQMPQMMPQMPRDDPMTMEPPLGPGGMQLLHMPRAGSNTNSRLASPMATVNSIPSPPSARTESPVTAASVSGNKGPLSPTSQPPSSAMKLEDRDDPERTETPHENGDHTSIKIADDN